MPIFKEVSSRLHSADLYYHIIGNGDVKLLFVQGLAMSMHVWDYQIAHFRQFPQFQILLFDNRGVGGSAKPWGPYTTHMLAEDARLLVEHVGWTSNIHVIGHSLGGMIVQRLVLSAPSYFKSMFVISTHMGGFRSCVPCCGMIGLIRVLFSCSRSARLHSMVELLHSKEFLSSRPPIKGSNSTSLPLYSSDVAHSDTGPSHYAQVFQFYDLVEWRGGGPSPVGCLSQTYAAFTHGLSNAEIRALKSSQIPIYIVSGTDDFVVHVRNSRHMARVLSGSYDEFPGVGHSVQTEAAKELNDVLWTGIAQAEGCN